MISGCRDEITGSLKQLIPPHLIGAHGNRTNERGAASFGSVVRVLTAIKI